MQIFYLNITNSDSLIEFAEEDNISLDPIQDVANKTSIKFVKSLQKTKKSSSKAKKSSQSTPINNLETASNPSETVA